MSDYDETIQRITTKLKEPVRIDPALNARVMAEISKLPPHSRTESSFRQLLQWFQRPRTVQVSPLSGLAAAAAFGVAVIVGSQLIRTPDPAAQVAMIPAAESAAMQFVLIAPEAESVSLVGDFNDWDVGATPLLRRDGNGVWSVTIPLNPGRYRYSFLVDGTTWLRDPQAARTVEDEFGRPNSVLTIGGA